VEYDAGGLTPAHCAVIEKQRQKGAKRKALALLEGTLLPEEQSHIALADAAGERLDLIKRAKKRVTAAAKRQRRCTAIASYDLLRGLPVFLEDAQPNQDVADALSSLGCNIVQERTDAKVIVVKDVSDLGVRTKWCTALVGNYVTTVDTLALGRGPILSYCAAREVVPRTVWMSQKFQERHPKVASILQTLAFSSDALQNGSRWTLDVSEQPLSKRVTVLKTKSEDRETLAPKGNTCYDVESFFALIAKVRALYKLRPA
jgi:hypothetical protein